MDNNILINNNTGSGKEEKTAEQKNGSEEIKNKELGNNKKRGRPKENETKPDKKSKEQNKFFIDVSKEFETKEMILNLLDQANKKDYGREIILKDLILVALPKLTAKDVEKIQEGCLSGMEKIERALDEHNKKNDQKLTLEEFLVKRLNIS